MFAQEENPPWGVEPRFELGHALQADYSALTIELCYTYTPCELRCTLRARRKYWRRHCKVLSF
jgi:hypothetical protein